MKTSELIINRINESNAKKPHGYRDGYKANDNISKFVRAGEKEAILKEVEEGIEGVLRSLIIDIDHDHNTKETAKRVAKMFVKEIFAGRYEEPPKITTFPNIRQMDEMYVTGPITVRSTCAHHFMPIRGVCYIGVYPGTNVLGLSKFNRIVDWVASRPQIQEEMTFAIADEVQKMVVGNIDPNETKGENTWGVAVLVQAEHFCLTHRGVKEHDSAMTTTVLRGRFKDKPNLKHEFFDVVKLMQDKK